MPISFENGRYFLQNGIPHDIRSCSTVSGYVWCPAHQDKFLENSPCDHYTKYKYEPGMAEGFFIKLILANYREGDWHSRRNGFRNGSKMKKSVCKKCNAPIHNMSYSQQRLHERMHEKESKQNVLSEFF